MKEQVKMTGYNIIIVVLEFALCTLQQVNNQDKWKIFLLETVDIRQYSDTSHRRLSCCVYSGGKTKSRNKNFSGTLNEHRLTDMTW